MRRDLLLASFAAILLLGTGAAASSAQTAASVQLEGSARSSSGRSGTNLVLSADAADGSGYHLDSSLAAAPQEQRKKTTSRLTSLHDHDEDEDEEHGRGEGRRGRELERERQPPAVAATLAASPRPEGDHTFWYLARAAGLSAYLMLFANVFLGMAVHLRPLDGLLARWRSFDLHQFTALLALGFMVLHALALLGDRYIGFAPAELLVPFASPYRPLWTALGVIAFYLVLAVFASSRLRRFVGHRAWRAIHYLSFAAFLLAMGHGLFAGTDSGEPWAAALYGATGAVIALLLALRFRKASHSATMMAPFVRFPSQNC